MERLEKVGLEKRGTMIKKKDMPNLRTENYRFQKNGGGYGLKGINNKPEVL